MNDRERIAMEKGTSGGKKRFSSVKVAFTFGTRFARASRDFFLFFFINFSYRFHGTTKELLSSPRFYDITRTFICAFLQV